MNRSQFVTGWLPESRSHFATLNNGENLVPDGVGRRAVADFGLRGQSRTAGATPLLERAGIFGGTKACESAVATALCRRSPYNPRRGWGFKKPGGDKDSAPHGAGRRTVAGDYILSTQLLLDESVGERLFRLLVGDAFTINVMGHLVNQNVIQVKPA